jgi:deferrochelatase/peroxidase EfeB
MKIDLGNLQSSVYRSSRLPHGYILLFQFKQGDAGRARNFLNYIASLVTTADSLVTRADMTNLEKVLNVGITYEGLQALGLPASILGSLPEEYTDPRQSEILKTVGDIGRSDPDNWWGRRFKPDAIHCLLHMFANTPAHLREMCDKVRSFSAQSEATELVPAVEGHSPEAIEVGWPYGPRKVHFGFSDGFSQPRIAWNDELLAPAGEEPYVSPEAFLIGYRETGPDVATRKKWFGDSTYAAFRWLRQDAAAFAAFLDSNAMNMKRFHPDQNPSDQDVKEWLAAKMMGRWRDGTPLTLSPGAPNSELATKFFSYAEQDPKGYGCPLTSHIRLTNPRDDQLRPGALGSFDDVPRLIRRGAPFGPAWKPGENDDAPRGLAGMFLTGDLKGFEIVMSWIHRAEFSTLFERDSSDKMPQDPVIGNPLPTGRSKEFRIKMKLRRAIASPLKLFVWTIGAANLLLPTKSLLHRLAAGDFE